MGFYQEWDTRTFSLLGLERAMVARVVYSLARLNVMLIKSVMNDEGM